MRAVTYIIARFYEARAARALQAYFALSQRAEKFFRRLDGGRE
jgi:hypothetical protein